MSKNTQISELINYISVDGSGNIVMTGNLIMPGGVQAATQTYVNTAISNLINAAPAALDTLAELSTALNNDASFATTITNSLATKLALSGGTLTGALNGTTATFSGIITASDNIKVYGAVQFYFNNAFRGQIVSYNTYGGGSDYSPFFTSETSLAFGVGGNTIKALNIASTGAATFSSSLSIGDFFRLTKSSSVDIQAYTGSAYSNLNYDAASHNWQTSGGIAKMILTSTGNLGIGTTSPIAALHVYSANQNMASSGLTSYTNSKFRLEPFNTSSVGISMGLISPNVNYIQAGYSDGSTSPLSLQPYGGNVLIGASATIGFGGVKLLVKSASALDYEALVIQASSNSDSITIAHTGSIARIASTYGSGGTGTFTDLVFATSGTDRVCITAGGNLGVGTTSVANGISGTETVLKISNSNAASLYFECTTTGKVYANYIGPSNNLVWYDLSSNAARMVISNIGRVGIGTTAPGTSLDVVGSVSLTGTVYATIRASQDQTNYRGTVLGYDSSGQIGVVYSESNGLASSLTFWTYSGSSWGERVRITGSGDFGIGTNGVPSGKFHVDHGDIYHMGILHTYDSTYVTTTKFGRPSTSSYLALTYDIAGSEIAYVNRAYPVARLLFQRAGTTDVEISGSGKVGIGITGPDYKLDVNGPIRASRVVYQWYWGSWQGNGTYWHMKTDLWGGGGSAGNSQYTMSFFKGYSYSYSGSILEGSCGFHNWSGTIYSLKTTGNIFSNVYVSSDGYVVLVVPSGYGETGVVIDWHQHFEYPTRVCNVTAAGLYGSTSGKY